MCFPPWLTLGPEHWGGAGNHAETGWGDVSLVVLSVIVSCHSGEAIGQEFDTGETWSQRFTIMSQYGLMVQMRVVD